MRKAFLFCSIVIICAFVAGCGGAQEQQVHLDIRPLEENRAFDIIEEMLAERGYAIEKDVTVSLSGTANFACDYRASGQKIAIEYLTEQDRLAIGTIPAPAAGSRLHVLNARVVTQPQGSAVAATGGNPRGEPVYVFFIDDQKFTYHFNPTSDHRADVTFLEVDSRLRRDLADFLSWYETNIVKR